MLPEHYPPGSSPSEMLAVDLAGAKEDPYAIMESDNTTWTVSGELLDVQ